MSTGADRGNAPGTVAGAGKVGMKLEVSIIPVSDVDRAREFYKKRGSTSFGSASDLASAMRRASTARGKHEKRIGTTDPNWPDWYAKYMAAEQAGAELPT